jgi:flagellar hook assembly protein FlgD
MRYGIILALALTWLVAGATCFPLVNLDPGPSIDAGITLAVSVMKPAEDRDVPQGAVIEIEWTAANLTGFDAIATILVRAREDFSETILEGGLRLPEAGGSRSLEWDTSTFQGGAYSIVARVEAGSRTEEASAPARITINTPPSFDFTEPTEDTELVAEEDPNDPNAPEEDPKITIRWTAFDRDGDATAQIGVDPIDPNDPDDLDRRSGDEITIAEVAISRSEGIDSLDWDGTDMSNDRVESGEYHLFAIISDDLNGERVVEPAAEPKPRLIVPEVEDIELAVTQPEEDTEFLTTDGPLTIEFTLDEDDDVLVDLEIDTDNNPRNGNETPILSERLIEEGTHEDSFEWDGTDADGAAVGDGIYRMILVVNRGAGTPAIVAGKGLVFRRSEEGQPLIGLTEPNGEITINVGTDVLIQWRDEDPDETATIRLTLDDDELPAEETETDSDEIEILADRAAAGDDVQDTFNLRYHVLKDLEPGRYYIFAYIDSDDTAPADNVSIAGGELVIEDPEASGE